MQSSLAQQSYNVAWSPQSGGQMLASICTVKEMLLHGNRGSGKTDMLLYLYLRHVGKGYGLHYIGIIYRCEFKELGDIVNKANDMIPKIFPTAKFKQSASEYKWVFEGGEQLLFRHAKKEDDYKQYHGWEIPFIGFDELTNFPSLDFYQKIKSCNRSKIKGIPKLIVSSTNPSGISHNQVKEYFIDKAQSGQIIYDETDVRKRLPRIHIALSFVQNKFIAQNDPDYVERLRAITDPNLKDAWLFGKWDIVSGGAFDDLWDQSIHVYDPNDIYLPPDWKITRGFDWGQSRPASCGWYVTCPRNEVIRWGKGTKYISKGTMFRIGEYYFADPKKFNTGLRWGNKKMANTIKEIEQLNGWNVKAGAADSAMFAERPDEKSQYDYFEEEGVHFEKSVKGQGSVMKRMSLTRERLGASVEAYVKNKPMEEPAFFVSSECKQAIRQIPLLKRDKKNIEEVDSSGEDHLYDEQSYQFTLYEASSGMFSA